ncbi:MAG: molybdenum cofactor biosynthesis protein C [Verrucomicrobia bacterium 61-8]|jgi:cyclic pyranopterin phosphate synthase|nr:cyclic pyranopterin monophosphate synthase MoaC [Verrucomicrobiota bacterium]OJV02245.1 MAG: molybdenum cofactor biosynthesis protein C [Verrucomicrobia bacterium 61-8]
MKLSHIDDQGKARMVDVGGKPIQKRTAKAVAELHGSPATLQLLKAGNAPKGDALAVARIAGIQAAKRTDEWIPLCHTLPLDQVLVDFQIKEDRIEIISTARTQSRTGVEMEALTAVTAAALTLYDMLKAVDKAMRIEAVRVLEKTKE